MRRFLRATFGSFLIALMLSASLAVAPVELSFASEAEARPSSGSSCNTSSYSSTRRSNLKDGYGCFINRIVHFSSNFESKMDCSISYNYTWRTRNERHHIIAQYATKMQQSRNKWVNTFSNSIHDWPNTVNIDYGFHRHTHTNSWYTVMNARFINDMAYESTWKTYLKYAGWNSWDYAEDATKNANACWRANVVY